MARSTLQVRLVTAAAGVATILATSMLTGCGTGQVAATARITSAVPGGNARVPVPAALNVNSAIVVENATVDYNDPAGYAKGGDAPLSLWIINQTPFPVTVTPVSADITHGGTTGSSSAGQLDWTDAKHQAEKNAPTPAPTPAPSGSTKGGKPKPSGSPTDLPTPVPSPSSPGLSDITIAPGGIAMLTSANGQYLEIGGLTGDLQPGDIVTIKLNFKVDASAETDAQGKSTGRGTEEYAATVIAPVGPPLSPAPRVPANG